MISLKEVQHIAELARIEFSEKEIKGLQKELSSILDYFNKLKEVNIEEVEPIIRTAKTENIMRKDEGKKFPTSKKLLKLAPQIKGNFIKVKSIL